MQIITTQKSETAEYAAQELKKYISKMSCGNIVPQISVVDTLPEDRKGKVILATLEELSLDTSDLNDPIIEDILDVNITNLSGYIAGSNNRSILMGVYKYCYSAGCRFIRPGEDGDYIPKADLTAHSFKYRKKADYPFRGECVEGAVSYEHMRDTLYWLPKVGMNLYMIEGLVPYAYMNRWYSHKANKYLKCDDASYEMLEDKIKLFENDIARTGIQYHTLGHAWMFEPFGIHTGDPNGEKAIKNLLSQQEKRHMALVGGKRDLCHGHSFFTHFCYSNPETRDILTSYLAKYISENKHVDFVHFWLADSVNNQCECVECQKMIPSDWYVIMMNELDEKLTAIGSDAKVVFILYNETLRPPRTQRIKNANRFIMLGTGPLHCEYPYKDTQFDGEEIPFVRNQYKKATPALIHKWYKDWKDCADGEMLSAVFEYRFYRDLYCDLGNMQISREAHRDMISLADVGYGGSISDQTHRMYMPTSLPLIAFGETLFDKNVNFETIADEYFEGAFGEDGKLCREYLEKLTKLLCPSAYRVGGRSGLMEEALGDDLADEKKCWLNNSHVAECAGKIPDLIKEFKPVIYKNIAKAENNAHLMSWNYLRYHSEICMLFSKILFAGASNGKEAAKEHYLPLAKYLQKHELEFHNVFDVFLYMRALVQKLDIPDEDLW